MANNSDFFNKISSNCNYIDPKLSSDVYYAVIRTILQDLRQTGKSVLPEFGKFVVAEHKSHKVKNTNTGEMMVVPDKNVIKFLPFDKLKHYIHNKM
jgi:nucleoid DNA-binding protein